MIGNEELTMKAPVPGRPGTDDGWPRWPSDWAWLQVIGARPASATRGDVTEFALSPSSEPH